MQRDITITLSKFEAYSYVSQLHIFVARRFSGAYNIRFTRICVIAATILVFLFANPLLAAQKVVSSIKPVQLITNQITQGVSQSVRLVRSSVSPHSFRLRPSDAQLLKNATLVIWVGPGLESKIAKSISTLVDAQRTLTLTELTLPVILKNRNVGLWHSNDRQYDNGAIPHTDPHIWLNPKNVVAIATNIANRLCELDEKNCRTYEINTQQLIKEVNATDRRNAQQLLGLKNMQLLSMHDSTQYFETHYKLTAVGTVSIDSHRETAARHVANIRKAIKGSKVDCILHKPNANNRMLRLITEGSSVRVVEIDPLGSKLARDTAVIADLLNRLAQQYLQCIAE